MNHDGYPAGTGPLFAEDLVEPILIDAAVHNARRTPLEPARGAG